jgi:hypothetical protein
MIRTCSSLPTTGLAPLVRSGPPFRMNLDHNTTGLAGAVDGAMDVGLPGLDGAEEGATELRRGMGAGGPDSAELR